MKYDEIVTKEWIHVAVVEADEAALKHRIKLLEAVAEAARAWIDADEFHELEAEDGLVEALDALDGGE